MQQDIRISQRNKIKPTHILLSTGSMLFCTNIVNKYVPITKSSHYKVLNYLLNQSFSSINLIQKKFEQTLLKQYKKESYFSLIQNSVLTSKNFLLHKYKMIQNHVLTIQDKNVSKNKTVLPFLLTEDVFPSGEIKHTVLNSKNILFHKYKMIQNHVVTMQDKKVLKKKKVSPITLPEDISPRKEIKNTILKSKNFLFHNHEIVKNHAIKRETEEISLGYKNTMVNRWETETNNVYLVHKHDAQQEEISAKAVQTELHENKVTHPIVTEKSIIERHDCYEIKRLAKKVYPLVMKQWQKEFERRGVFYG